ncbi:MAG TPA: GNAT family N-acetyltransferase [Candidatus Bathyarchaeia archaeon]|nr:GNAT family N-acetyltransferase [Candidatus Bathyarchaeia archaeon]
MQSRLFKRFVTDDGRTVVLRQPHRRDAERLLVFINGLVNEKGRAKSSQLYTGFESPLTLKQEKAWLGELLTEIRNGKVISVVAEVDGKIVGNGEIVRGEYKETRHHGRLAVTIHGTHRGLGIGREMIRTLLAEARRQRLRNVHVEFLAGNKQAVSAYEKAGFKKFGAIPGKVYRNERFRDAIIMARTI